jgi:hypothetical protein
VGDDARLTPLTWLEREGIVLQSARHPLFPSLVEHIAGEPIAGSWWGHKKGHDIFRALGHVYASPDVVATKLVAAKLTLIHRRLWAALAALAFAERIPGERLDRVTQEHTASGRHENRVEPFPAWLPRGLRVPSVEAAIELVGRERVAVLGVQPREPARRERRRRGQRG